MKKSWIYMVLGIAAVFAACDPIENRESMGEPLTADQLNISAAPVVKEGVNSNYIELNSDGNACLSSWDYGFGTLNGTKGTVKVMTTGPNDIIYTGLNPDGSKITKTLTVQVDRLFDVDPEWEMLCGTGEKEWVWDTTTREDGRFWGNGGRNSDVECTWWGRGAADIGEEASYAGWGADAYMKFSIKGAAFMKSSADGSKKETGSFSFTMNSDPSAWSKGEITFKGTSILLGISQNDGQKPVNSFHIIHLDNERMVLGYDTESSDGETWFWMFRAKK